MCYRQGSLSTNRSSLITRMIRRVEHIRNITTCSTGFIIISMAWLTKCLASWQVLIFFIWPGRPNLCFFFIVCCWPAFCWLLAEKHKTNWKWKHEIVIARCIRRHWGKYFANMYMSGYEYPTIKQSLSNNSSSSLYWHFHIYFVHICATSAITLAFPIRNAVHVPKIIFLSKFFSFYIISLFSLFCKICVSDFIHEYLDSSIWLYFHGI